MTAKPATPAKTKSAGKPRPTAWKPGQSGNPAGAPKRGQSWRELIAELGELDGPGAANRAGFLAKQLAKLPAGVSLKELVVLRVFTALIDDPQPGLLNAFMERVEGKVAQAVLDIDPSVLTDEQLERLKNGESIESVVTNTRGGRIGIPAAHEDAHDAANMGADGAA